MKHTINPSQSLSSSSSSIQPPSSQSTSGKYPATQKISLRRNIIPMATVSGSNFGRKVAPWTNQRQGESRSLQKEGNWMGEQIVFNIANYSNINPNVNMGSDNQISLHYQGRNDEVINKSNQSYSTKYHYESKTSKSNSMQHPNSNPYNDIKKCPPSPNPYNNSKLAKPGVEGLNNQSDNSSFTCNTAADTAGHMSSYQKQQQYQQPQQFSSQQFWNDSSHKSINSASNSQKQHSLSQYTQPNHTFRQNPSQPQKVPSFILNRKQPLTMSPNKAADESYGDGNINIEIDQQNINVPMPDRINYYNTYMHPTANSQKTISSHSPCREIWQGQSTLHPTQRLNPDSAPLNLNYAYGSYPLEQIDEKNQNFKLFSRANTRKFNNLDNRFRESNPKVHRQHSGDESRNPKAYCKLESCQSVNQLVVMGSWGNEQGTNFHNSTRDLQEGRDLQGRELVGRIPLENSINKVKYIRDPSIAVGLNITSNHHKHGALSSIGDSRHHSIQDDDFSGPGRLAAEGPSQRKTAHIRSTPAGGEKYVKVNYQNLDSISNEFSGRPKAWQQGQDSSAWKSSSHPVSRNNDHGYMNMVNSIHYAYHQRRPPSDQPDSAVISTMTNTLKSQSPNPIGIRINIPILQQRQVQLPNQKSEANSSNQIPSNNHNQTVADSRKQPQSSKQTTTATVFNSTNQSCENFKPTVQNHYLSTSDQSNPNVRHKKSVKKMLVSQSKKNQDPSADIHLSLKYRDLHNKKSSINDVAENEDQSSSNFIDKFIKNHVTKVFCATFKIGENNDGCNCRPKCRWINKWLQKANSSQIALKFGGKSLLNRRQSFQKYPKQVMYLRRTGDKDKKSGHFQKKIQEVQIGYEQDKQTFIQIEKDIPRSCSDHPTFKTKKYLGMLRDLLREFYLLDRSLGYVQGMNIVGASVLYHCSSESEALQMMDFLMNVLNLRSLYEDNMSKCKELSQLTCQLMKRYCHDMYYHVVICFSYIPQTENCSVDLQMFIIGWYLSLLGTFVPMEAMHLVIDRFVEKQFRGLMEIVVTYFIFVKDILMSTEDESQIMEELSLQKMVKRSERVDWEELIRVSNKLPIDFISPNGKYPI